MIFCLNQRSYIDICMYALYYYKKDIYIVENPLLLYGVCMQNFDLMFELLSR